PVAMIHAVGFQFSRGSPQSVWAALGLDGVQPLAQACVVGLVAGAAVTLRRDPAIAGDSARVAALAAAILLSLQLAADYWTFLYLVWVVPLLSVSLFASRSPVAVGEQTFVPVAGVRTLATSGAD